MVGARKRFEDGETAYVRVRIGRFMLSLGFRVHRLYHL